MRIERRILRSAAAISCLGILIPLAPAPGPTVQVGADTLPSAVLTALDERDADTLDALFAKDVHLTVLDLGDQPITVEGPGAARQFVDAWSEADANRTTKLLGSRSLTNRPELRCLVFEFERDGEPARQYRATLCAEQKAREDADPIVRVIHMHVSSAEREDR